MLEDCVEKEYCYDDFSFNFHNLGNTARCTSASKTQFFNLTARPASDTGL